MSGLRLLSVFGLLCCLLPREEWTAAAALSSSSNTPLIPRTTASPAVASPAPYTSNRPQQENKKRTVEGYLDDVDDDTSGNLRQCRCEDGQHRLYEAFRAQCPLPFHHDNNDGDGNQVIPVNPSGWAPWTHPPACVPGKDKNVFCVFTKATFGDGDGDGGRGLSIVAPPQGASHLAAVLRRVAISPSIENNDENLDVRAVPGKNLGVVARQHIRRGTVLLVERASLLVDSDLPRHVRRAQGRRLLRTAVARLPQPAAVRALSRRGEVSPSVAAIAKETGREAIDASATPGLWEEDVLGTNSFTVAVNGIAYMVLFPKIARINHACQPTAITRFNEHDLTQRVIAFRDIAPGEEITISYIDFGLTHTERQTALTRRWGFSCECHLCRGGPTATAASDTRRRRVAALRDELVQTLRKGEFETAIRMYENELLALVRVEQLAEHLGDHYAVLARLHLAAGNRTAAGAYAVQALDELTAFGSGNNDGRGEDAAASSSATIKELRAFVQALKGRAGGPAAGKSKNRVQKKQKQNDKQNKKQKSQMEGQQQKSKDTTE
ncbi:SET domain protein [Niveomyces insectorum RCEF 264]|uniref:SET domain protein n=1 Tax=Niveomyces insectorum RCEF 264 TaxID=1081102 RepID=A0A167SS66_9HYPO|nr:SET domain protein [Niveomyces insectorum RCEF 264]